MMINISTRITAPLALATIMMLPGCANSGKIENPTLIFPFGSVTLPSIEWGPAAQLPEGSTFDCNIMIEGQPVQLHHAPSGAPWFIDSDGHAHPIVSGDYDCDGPITNSPDPILIDNSISAISTHSIKYEFDESTDYAKISFTMPADKTFLYRNVSLLPFLANESTIQLINGDLAITYDGTINDVLGALWWVGVGEISFTNANGVSIDIIWNPDMNVVTVDTSVGSEMIVMTPTNLVNWPLAN